MEEGGFTLVGVASDNMASKSKKHKVVDKDQTTTMLGISQSEAKKAYERALMRGAPITGLSPEEYEAERARIVAENEQEDLDDALEQSQRLKQEGLPSMYKPQKLNKRERSMMQNKLMYSALSKDKKKEDLEKLREEFERNKRRIAKQQAKLVAAQ
uniref:Uncharacterized protein n=1 Tax=Strombidium inclinatum TaxID=197538 RepID=A0A7S3IQ21_9SPIT|mmetsp:Transcript_31108/g.47522  ORF Transcript_31108/g.47522 Transcript_31108/m.47522 type:complete len:156 (+) Transcript_31108:468-935(+)